MRRFKMPRLFVSLVLASCLIGILPLLLLGYLAYDKSSSIVLEEVMAGNKRILQQTKEQVEAHLKLIDALTTQTINSPVTTTAVSMSTVLDLEYDYANIRLFDSLIYKLQQIQVFELGVTDVHLISFRQNWLVDGGAVYSMDNRDTSTMKNRQLHQLQMQLTAYKNDPRRSYWKLERDDRIGFVLKMIKRIPVNSLEPYGAIVVNVPLAEIGERLSGEGWQGIVSIVDREGMVIAHPDGKQVGRNIADTPYGRQFQQQQTDEGDFSYAWDGETYAALFVQAGYNDWVFIAHIPTSDLTGKSNIIKRYTSLSIAIMIVLIITVSIVTSLRTYSPIRRIRRFMKQDIPHSGGNELQDIGDQVQRMVQSQSKMVHENENLNRQVRVYFVIKLLQGEMKQSGIIDELEKYGYPTGWEQWCLIAVQIDTLDNTPYSERDFDLIMFAIQNLIEEIVLPGDRLSPIVQNKCLLLLIGSSMTEMRPLKVQVFQYAERIQQSVRHYLKLKISIGISRTYSHFSSAPAARQESLAALTYRIRLGPESILFIDEAEPDNRGQIHYPKDMEFAILEAIRQLDHAQAKHHLEQMVSRFFEKHVSHYDYQAFLVRLFSALTGMVQDYGTSIQLVFREDIFTSGIMPGMHSIKEILTWFDAEVLIPLLAWMEEQQQKRDVNITQVIIDGVHQDYDKELSIELFASRLNYHPGYVSRVFKKDTGTSFSDYLSKYRMEIAKKWLAETEMKIGDIAVSLCYSTPSNFNRHFKKLVKLTPSEYREMHKRMSD